MLNLILKHILLLFFISSCVRKDHDLEIALTYANENRLELERVLKHYKDSVCDSLKYKSAVFLIKNMPYHYYMNGDSLTSYFNKLAYVNDSISDFGSCRAKYDSINIRCKNIFYNSKWVSDITTLDSDFLISHIDHAYDKWQNGNWAKHLSFDDFCEYLLPYRVKREQPELWREELDSVFSSKISWVTGPDKWKNSTFFGATYLNDQLRWEGYRLSDIREEQIDYPYCVLKNLRMGTCREYSLRAVYVMRAVGIPVGIDYATLWPNGGHGHAWNTLLTQRGNFVPFMGGETNPDLPHCPHFKFSKMFRHTYGYQKQSLFHKNIKLKESLPSIFSTPHIMDVSELYFKGVDIKTKLKIKPKEKTKIAYLCAFDNKSWQPQQWGEISWNDEVIFESMGRDVVYLPVYNFKDGLQSAGYPIMVNPDGTLKELIPDTLNIDTITINRKYPHHIGLLVNGAEMEKSRFEASDTKDFSKIEYSVEIEKSPWVWFDSLDIVSDKEYQYWRYNNPNNHCQVAEIEFISKGKKISEFNKVYSSSKEYDPKELLKTFDNDGLTYYRSDNRNSWIAVDFGEKQRIDKIRYLPRNDDNNVWIGDEYELVYWNGDNWRSLGRQVANTYNLTYQNVPKNSLLLLHNLTKGVEERIFTMENGKQVWW